MSGYRWMHDSQGMLEAIEKQMAGIPPVMLLQEGGEMTTCLQIFPSATHKESGQHFGPL